MRRTRRFRTLGRVLATVLAACLLQPSAWAQSDPAASAQSLDAWLDRFMAAKQNPPDCHELSKAFLRDPPDVWSAMAFRVWVSAIACDAHPGGRWEREPITAEQLRQAWAPVFRHFQRMPPELRLQDDLLVDVHVLYWRYLRFYNASANGPVADVEEAATLDDWYTRAARHPADPLAVASLTRLGRAVYGMRWLAAWMEQQQQRLEASLGPGHPATLNMMRSRIFAFRAHERPADALALSDEYAARLMRSPSHDVRLAMGNRSERIGALAALGRHAEAVDEGRLLLDWLQQQRPLPLGAIMRTGYNLASAALAMGDAETAEAMARLSRDHGLRSDSHDRGESIVAERLIHQARLLRGDEAAGPDLKAAWQGVISNDLQGVDSMYSLYQWAGRQGDVETRRWAGEQIEQVTRDSSTSLQPARALPLLLRADSQAPGSDTGRQAAAAALAHGLAADAQLMEVRPTLALMRHLLTQQPAGAAWLCKRAAQALVDWRQLLPEQQAGEPRLWLAEHESGLRRCVGLLIDLGRLGEAEQLLGVLREEELHEFQRRSRGAVRMATRVAAFGFTSDEQRRNASVEPLQQRLRQEALAARQRADAQPDQKMRRGGDDPQADALLSEAWRELQSLGLQPAPEASQRVARPSTRAAATLPAGHARLTYVLGSGVNGDSWALVDVGRGQRRLALPVKGRELSRTVAELRAQIAGSGEQLPPAARQLHRWLIEPLRPVLAGVRHLHIVPDGVLRYLPFAALHDGQRFLVEAYSLNLALSANVPHQPVPDPARQSTVAAFGNSQPSATHSALPGVRDELAALDRLPPARVQRALDGAFTRDSLQQALQRQPQVVHLASHFVLTPASEEDSYLLLGDGQRLSLRELRQLPWQGVRVALLSACDSALPLDHDATTQGREWAGFAAALQRAGVPEVMATLWRIDDDSAARWMGGFYDGWARQGRSAAPDAGLLARTQRQWLKQHRHGALAHPRHWAGFVWIGR